MQGNFYAYNLAVCTRCWGKYQVLRKIPGELTEITSKMESVRLKWNQIFKENLKITKPNKILRYNPKLFHALSSVKPPDINEIQISPFVKKAAKTTKTMERALGTGKHRQLTDYFFHWLFGKSIQIYLWQTEVHPFPFLASLFDH